jgi:hypothetical protein
MEILTLIIAIISLGFGLPSVIIFFRQKNTKLIYLEKKQINIQEDFLQNFNDLSIEYKGTKISSKLIFVRGSIICDGSKDICTASNQIQIKSPEETKWIDFKVISKSEGLEVAYNSDDNIANINFDLFKSKEHFEFEGFVELIEPIKNNKINLTFFHRIPNIRNIQKLVVEDFKVTLPVLLSTMIISFLVIMFSVINLDIFSIDRYNVNIYDSKTDTLIIDDNCIRYSTDFINLLEQLKKEGANYFSLMTNKSENYVIEFMSYKKDFEKEKIDIYIKTDVNTYLILLLITGFGAIILFFSWIYLLIYYFSKRKYLYIYSNNNAK